MRKPIGIVVCLLTALPLIAGDGAIPIWEPTVITEPGHYVVTRNITSNSGPVIEINMTGGVYLDLNGFYILALGSAPAITITGGGSNITIRNGMVQAACSTSTQAAVRMSGNRVHVTELKIDSWGCGAGIYSYGGTGNRFSHNVIWASAPTDSPGIEIEGGSGTVVVHNNITPGGGHGLSISGHEHAVVADNIIYGGTPALRGIHLEAAWGGRLVNNTVHGDIYLRFQSGSNNIEGNVVQGNIIVTTEVGVENNVFRGNLVTIGHSLGTLGANHTNGDNFGPTGDQW